MPDQPPFSPVHLSCSGIILAGGQATRMGGIDKGWVEWHGEPLIQHVINRIAPQVDDVVISANRSLDQYRALGHRVVSDQQQDFAGPLAGIAAALALCRHDWALVVACDCPLFPLDLYTTLQQARQQQALVLVHDGDHLQPLFMLIHRQLLPSLQQALAQQQYKVGQWARMQSPRIVQIHTPEAFINLNTPADLQSWSKMMR